MNFIIALEVSACTFMEIAIVNSLSRIFKCQQQKWTIPLLTLSPNRSGKGNNIGQIVNELVVLNICNDSNLFHLDPACLCRHIRGILGYIFVSFVCGSLFIDGLRVTTFWLRQILTLNRQIRCVSGIWTSLTWFWRIDISLKSTFGTVSAASKILLSLEVVKSESKLIILLFLVPCHTLYNTTTDKVNKLKIITLRENKFQHFFSSLESPKRPILHESSR